MEEKQLQNRTPLEKKAPDIGEMVNIFSKGEYLGFNLAFVRPRPDDAVLDVGAGTCAVSRAFSPYVRAVVPLDVSEEALEKGRKAAEKEGLSNLIYVKGMAEDLPFLDETFDITHSRLAFHHFKDVWEPFSEMARVTKKGGRVVLVDMEASAEPYRVIRDKIERLRDPSHVSNYAGRNARPFQRGGPHRRNEHVEGHPAETDPVAHAFGRLEEGRGGNPPPRGRGTRRR